jgi:hypothetical protein
MRSDTPSTVTIKNATFKEYHSRAKGTTKNTVLAVFSAKMQGCLSQSVSPEESMRASDSLTMAILAVAAIHPLLSAQESGVSQPSSRERRKPVLHLYDPYTATYNEKQEYTDNEGRPIPSQESTEVRLQDSQGRRLFRHISPDGSSTCQVWNFIDGIKEIKWNSRSSRAKLVLMPTALEGRNSCWKFADQRVDPDDPDLGSETTSCRPVGSYPQWGCRDPLLAELMANALPRPKEGFPKCDPAEPGGLAEDLGITVIQGVTAHGCRSTTPFPKGKRKLREIWSDDYGLTLRRIEEDPTEAKYYEDLISLSRGEPGTTTFQPPKDYKVVTVEMQEIPCAQSASPHPH